MGEVKQTSLDKVMAVLNAERCNYHVQHGEKVTYVTVSIPSKESGGFNVKFLDKFLVAGAILETLVTVDRGKGIDAMFKVPVA